MVGFFFSSLRATGGRQAERAKHGTLEVYLYLRIHLAALLSSKAKGPPLLAETTNRAAQAARAAPSGKGDSGKDGARGRILPLGDGGENAESRDGEGVRRSETLRCCFPKERLYRWLGRRRFRGRAGSRAVPKMSHREERWHLDCCKGQRLLLQGPSQQTLPQSRAFHGKPSLKQLICRSELSQPPIIRCKFAVQVPLSKETTLLHFFSCFLRSIQHGSIF